MKQKNNKLSYKCLMAIHFYCPKELDNAVTIIKQLRDG